MIFNYEDDELNFFNQIENNKISKNFFSFEDSDKNQLDLIRINTASKITEDVTNKNIPTFQQNSAKLENFDIIGKKRIFSIRKMKKLFILEKRGRPKKTKKKILGPNQGKNRDINAFPKIRNSVRDQIDFFIKKNFKGLGDLDIPIINDSGKINNDKSVYEMYCDFVPKKFKGDWEIKEKDKKKRKILRKEAYIKISKNKKFLDEFINEEIREHDIIFNVLKFKDFLKAYLNNEKRIVKYDKKYGKLVINLNGFETYDNFFNWEYDKIQKETFKEHMLEKLDKE